MESKGFETNFQFECAKKECDLEKFESNLKCREPESLQETQDFTVDDTKQKG